MEKPSQDAIALSYQWRTGLMRTLKNIENGKADEYKVTLKDVRLIKLLLCLAHHKQEEVFSIVEDALIKQLSKDSCYRRYLENPNYNVRIATTTAIEFKRETAAMQPKDGLDDIKNI